MEEIYDEEYINELVNENSKLKGKNVELSSQMSSFASVNKNENVIQYQIENTELLEKLEHFYKGEYIGTLKNGKDVGWIKPEDETQIPLNEFGVSAMMEIVSKYIDKGTTLSYYSEMRVYEILADIGDEIVLFILANYEKMGMSDKFRKTKYRLLVVTTVHMIESAYRKAIGGKTIEEINQSRIISQSDFVGQRSLSSLQPKKKFNIINPRTWN